MANGGGVVLMDNVASYLQQELLAGRMTRRQLIVRAAGLGLSVSAIGALLAACGTTGATGGGSLSDDAPEVRVQFKLCTLCWLKTWTGGYEARRIYSVLAERAITLAKKFLLPRSRTAT